MYKDYFFCSGQLSVQWVEKNSNNLVGIPVFYKGSSVSLICKGFRTRAAMGMNLFVCGMLSRKSYILPSQANA